MSWAKSFLENEERNKARPFRGFPALQYSSTSSSTFNVPTLLQGCTSNLPLGLGQFLLPIMKTIRDLSSHFKNGWSLSFTMLLPRIIVIGSHQSGKSSVIASLVGRDFLPRCPTRRPLFIQLLRIPDGNNKEYVEFMGKKFYDWAHVRRVIQKEMERKDNGYRLHIQIFSLNVCEMTFYDYPPFHGDIQAELKEYMMPRLSLSNHLMLVVLSANEDLANSDVIQLARSFDPHGHRTIGVITKLDMMKEGTCATNILLGRVIPLPLGYVGVVNRSQQDIQDNCSIADTLAKERKFFCSHPAYTAFADCCGISQLAEKLNQILAEHMRPEVPWLKSGFKTELFFVSKELGNYDNQEVDQSKRQLFNGHIEKIDRDELFKKMKDEPIEVGQKRKRQELDVDFERKKAIAREKLREKLRKLEQILLMLEKLPLGGVETAEKGYRFLPSSI